MKKCNALICFLEFLVATVILCFGIYYRYGSNFPSDFEPFITTDIDHPLRTSNASYPLLIVVFVVFGLAMMGIVAVNRFDITIIKVATAYYFSIALSFAIAAIAQRLIGRPKPDTKEYCGATYAECAKVLKKGQLREQFRSFPSLFATLAMNSGIFLSLLLSEVWCCFNMMAVLCKLVPVLFGLFIGASQVWNGTNHIDDVLAGMFIGTLIAFFAVKSLIADIKMNTEHTRSANEMSTASASTTTNQKLFQGYV